MADILNLNTGEWEKYDKNKDRSDQPKFKEPDGNE